MSTSPGGGGWLGSLTRRSPPSPQQPVVAVELAAQQRLGNADSSTGSQPQQIVRKQQPNWETHPQCGSSGAGLPSALSTPYKAAAGSKTDCDTGLGRPPLQAAVRQPQQAQKPSQQQDDDDADDGAAGGSGGKVQQRVRWLPGLQAGPAAGGGTSSTSTSAPPVPPSASAVAPGATPQGSSRPGDSQPPTSSSSSSNRSRAPLPSSGDAQLDKYLIYLLEKPHPHRYLYYPEWGLTDDGCAAIGEFLRRDRRIKAMTLSGNSITDEGVELLAEGLRSNGSLITLDLSSNAISSDGSVALAEALHSEKCVLAELQLAHNRIGDEGAEALAAAVAGNSCLKKLNLAGNPISAGQLQVVAHVLKTREYKVPAEPRSSSRTGRHMRKASSSLQFDIELMEGQSLERSSSTGRMRHKDLLHVPPDVAVAALTEHNDALESSIAMQAAHLLAELQQQSKDAQSAATGAQPPAAAAAATSSNSSGSATAAAAAASTSGSSGNAGGTGSESEADAGSLQEQQTLLALLALRLAARGYDVVLRTCCPIFETGGGTGAGSSGAAVQQHHKHQHSPAQHAAGGGADLHAAGLRHSHLRVMQPSLSEQMTVQPAIIVDPFFTTQFVVPHATERYQSVLDALPRVLCLAEHRLWHLLELLSTELATAFKDMRLSLPPWRQAAAIHEKFLSLNHTDVVVDAESSIEVLQQSIAGLNLH